jgi:arylsulfatase A-like enzyme
LRRPPAKRLAPLFCLLLAGFSAACGGGDRLLLPPAPAAGETVPAGEVAAVVAAGGGLFEGAGEWAAVDTGHVVRPALVTSPAGWSWRGRLPAGARLQVGAGALPAAWEEAGRLTVTVGLVGDGESETLDRATAEKPQEDAAAGPPWLDLDLDLAHRAGEEVTLTFRAAFDRLPPQLRDRPLVAWGPVRLTGEGDGASRPDGAPPNVVLIVVDTLRADHLGFHGYERDTAPNVAAQLAGRGVVFEQAHAQAPWTLPSVISYMTGRHPSEMALPEVIRQGIREETPSLAERLRAAGYRTAAFLANPVLHPANGFTRGYESFYTPIASVRSISLNGDSVNRHLLPWLGAHAVPGGDPFFVYVHYVDPHDPYLNPEQEDGRSVFYPDYRGPVDGGWAHSLYVGQRRLPDGAEEAGRRHLEALYDSEIHYVDGLIGELLAAIPPEVAAQTLFVFTSDHGEEFLDHGWWKHGRTVYEEQLHVPFVLRWDGRLPAGRRVAEPVELLDLAPTVLAAAGVEAPAGWEGIDLLPVAAGESTPPRRVSVGQHLAEGPERAAALLDGWKLLLFNRNAPFAPEKPADQAIWQSNLDHTARVELYNLEDDPGERRNLAGERPADVARLAPFVLRRLDQPLARGLRVALGAVPAGAEVAGEIVFEQAPEGHWPLFLAAGDRVELDGRRVRFAWRGEGFAKGMRLAGEPGAVESVTVTVDGEPVAPTRVTVGDGRAYAGGRVAASGLEADSWPPGASLAGAPPPVLHLWLPGSEPPTGLDAAAIEETERRLRALGYIR